MDPEGALVEACRRGDRAALQALLRAHAPALERQLARLLGADADLEDVLQATLVAAVRAFPRFRGEAPVGLWLARIAVNVAHEHLRRPDRRRRVPLEVLGPADEPVDAAPPADRVTDGRRRLARLYHHLDSLGARNRTAFILHVLEGRPVDEVAAIVGASRVTTRSRVFLARRALLYRARRDPALRDWFDEEGGNA
jgi:RNA polymerase sigma-70 factor (ECF subfamily)